MLRRHTTHDAAPYGPAHTLTPARVGEMTAVVSSPRELGHHTVTNRSPVTKCPHSTRDNARRPGTRDTLSERPDQRSIDSDQHDLRLLTPDCLGVQVSAESHRTPERAAGTDQTLHRDSYGAQTNRARFDWHKLRTNHVS